METIASDSKIFSSFLLVLFYLAMGLFAEISGPTLTDLKLLYKTDYETITSVMAGRGIGGIFGTVLGGVLLEHYEHQSDIFLGVLTAVTGLALSYIPLAPSVEATWYGYFVLGLTVCLMNMLGTRQVLKIWNEKSSTVLQLMLMVYGVGALTMPLLCSPFLSTTGNQNDTTPDVDARQTGTRVHVPYLIVSAYLCMLSMLFCVSYLRMTNYGNHIDAEKAALKLKESLRTDTNSKEKSQRVVFLVQLFVFYFNYAGCEKIFGNFIRTISIDIHKLSKNTASYINTVFWCSYTCGRLIISILTRFVTTKALMLMNVVLHFGSICLMNYYAEDNLELFWALTFLEGLLMAPLFGLVISYGNTILEIKGRTLAIIIIAGNLGQFFYLSFAGSIYDAKGPTSVLDFICMPAFILIFPTVLMVFIKPLK